MSESKPHEIPVDANDVWVMLLSTIRYSMGRQTYMTSLCESFYQHYKAALSLEQRRQIADEIRRQLEIVEQVGKLLGQQCDHDSWKELVAAIDDELADGTPAPESDGRPRERVVEKLPHPRALLQALDWLRAGAPAAHHALDPVKAVKTLMALVDALPALESRYRFGDPENQALMSQPPAEESAP